MSVDVNNYVGINMNDITTCKFLKHTQQLHYKSEKQNHESTSSRNLLKSTGSLKQRF